MTILQSGIAQAAAGATGYQIARSLRFNIADSTYLNRTPASATNRQIFTYSLWIKNSGLPSTIQRIFGVGVTNYFGIDIGYSAGEFNINVDLGPDATRSQNYTTATFRDPSAWYHFVIAVDTTQATTANRLKIYVNNVLYSYSSTASIPQNLSTDVNNTVVHNIGRRVDGADRYCSLYMTEINLIDGQQLTPSSFGQTDSATGVWSPIAYTGTYGTNGFYLNFSDNSGTTSTTLGKDYSGNGNNWTPNNFSVTAGTGNDSLVDTPTNYGTDTGVGGEVRGNYCTLNPLDNGGNTLTDGNLSGNKGGGWSSTRATMACPTTGKWYWEAVITAGGNNMTVGIATNAAALSGDIIGRDAYGWGYVSGNGQKWTNGSGASYGATWTAGDIIGIAFDADAGTLTFYKNNTSQGTAFSSLTSGPYFPGVSFESTTGYVNFGQRPFTYTAPSGFKALCTQNLPTPAIGATSSTLASKNMNVVTYTGNNTTNNITGVGFQPDLVWIKSRSNAVAAGIIDAVRGVRNNLVPSSTVAETLEAAGRSLTAFNADGFTLGIDNAGASSVNANAYTYVGWTWKGANTTVSNTSGTITSTVSANPTAGISILTYTGTGTGGATIGHGLGVAPKMIITKARVATGLNWAVYHASLGATKNLWLSLSDAVNTQTVIWNDTAPTSSVFTVGSAGNTNSTQGMVAYCFAEVAGFSKISSYTGNGSADGPFVYTGFRPRYVMIKRTAAAGSWLIFDSARMAFNVADDFLIANSSAAEAINDAGNAMDILSNGFKYRGTDATGNGSTETYIFIAFAESPFNYSRAR